MSSQILHLVKIHASGPQLAQDFTTKMDNTIVSLMYWLHGDYCLMTLKHQGHNNMQCLSLKVTAVLY